MTPPRRKHPLQLLRLLFPLEVLRVQPRPLPFQRQRLTLPQRPGFRLEHRDLRRRSQPLRQPSHLAGVPLLLPHLPLQPLAMVALAVLPQLLLPPRPLVVLLLPRLLQLLVRHRPPPLELLVVSLRLAALPSAGQVVEEEQVLAAGPRRGVVDAPS